MNNLEILGFTQFDAFIAISCISAASFGALIDYTIKRDNYESLTIKPDLVLPASRYLPLIFGRVLLGVAGGIVVYLLLVGTISMDKSGYARLLLLSAGAGFAAPTIANKYKNKIPSQVAETFHNSPPMGK